MSSKLTFDMTSKTSFPEINSVRKPQPNIYVVRPRHANLANLIAIQQEGPNVRSLVCDRCANT